MTKPTLQEVATTLLHWRDVDNQLKDARRLHRTVIGRHLTVSRLEQDKRSAKDSINTLIDRLVNNTGASA